MKIIMYSVGEHENGPIDNWAAKNQVEVKKINSMLTIDNVHEAQGCDGICIQQTGPITNEDIYKQLASFGIKQMSTRSAGFDMFNLEYANKYGLTITNVPAYSPNAIAEMAVAHTMSLVRKAYEVQPRMANHDFTWKGLMVKEVRSMVIGVIGVGRIGSVYARLVSGLGAKVIGYDVVRRPEMEVIVDYQDSLEAVLEKADLISIHAPHNDTTENMINKTTLALMKPTAYVVNTARGAIINSADLIEALQNKTIAGAALDTVDGEFDYFNADFSHKEIKPGAFKTLLEMPNVIMTPHIAFFTETAVQNIVEFGLDNVMEVLETGTSKNKIN